MSSSSTSHSRTGVQDPSVVTYDDLYEGYNDYEHQLNVLGDPQTQTGESVGSKVDAFANYSHGACSQDSLSSGNQGNKADLYYRTATPQTASAPSWRPPSTGWTRVLSVASTTNTDMSRPLTAIRAAGYSSRDGRFDPLNQAARVLTPTQQKKEEPNPEYQCREMERHVNQLLEASAAAGLAGDYQTALEKSKEAGKRERLLCKHREQAGLGDQMNVELTFAVCFNLGYQFQANGLHSEALSTYSQIVKSKQFTQGGRLRVNMGNIYYGQQKYTMAIKMYHMALDQTPNSYKETRYRILRNIGNAFMRLGQYQDSVLSYEAIMEIKIDHQTCYNLIICYYVLGHTEKMKTCFTKMILVRNYDADSDDENEDTAMLRNDELREELRRKQNQAQKYILTAARLIAPVLGGTCMEGYDWVVELLKDQQYVALANEMEMDRAIQHLHKQDFGQAIMLLKEFEKKEKDLKARAATNLSFLYFLEGDLNNAGTYAELAVRTNRYNAHALVNQGNCLYTQGDVEGAKVVYREATEVEADCIEAIYNLALSHKRQGELGEALATFKKISSLQPNNIEVSFQIGHLNMLMGNIKQAIKWLEIVNTHVMHDAGILAMLGSLHAKCDDEPKALHYYSESHRAYPANMDITSWLGAFYVKNEVYEKAMPFFNLAAKIEPSEVKWQLMVASCYRRTGAYPLALAKYKEILLQHPENIECLRYLIHMYTSLGRQEEVNAYENQLRKVERGQMVDSHYQNRMVLDPNKGFSHQLLLESQAYAGNDHNSQVCDFSQQSTNSQGFLSSSGILNPRLISTHYPQPHRTSEQHISKKKERVDEDEWPELGDDLLPM